MGFVSIFLLLSFKWIFPNIQNILTFYPIICLFYLTSIEEVSKYLGFKLTKHFNNEKETDLAIFFYFCASYSTFAIIENILYVQKYGVDVLWVRSFSTTILHQLTGIFMAYFYLLSKKRNNPLLIIIFGGCLVSLFHLFFNLLALFTLKGVFLFIIFGLLLAKGMKKDIQQGFPEHI